MLQIQILRIFSLKTIKMMLKLFLKILRKFVIIKKLTFIWKNKEEMGQKCCQPQYRSNYPVYLVILSDIVDEVAQAEAEDQSANKQNMNEQIRVILYVHGYLRKLYDYLAAHRHYIQDSFKFIYLQISAKNSVYLMATFAEVSLKIAELLSQRDNPTNDEDNQEYRSKPHANLLKMYLQIEQTIFSIACDLLDQYIKSPKQLDFALQRPLKITLQILRQLSSEEVSTKLNTVTIKTVLDLLVKIMSSNSTQQNLALEVYRKIIEKFKFYILSGNIYKDIVKDHLKEFLKYWIRKVHTNDKNLKNHSSKLQKSLQKKELSIDNNHIEAILVQFFNSHFSYHESEQIFKQLMKIYDKEGFGEVLLEIQELVFRSLTQFDLREQFIYRWFDYLLNYMAVTKDYYESIWNLTDFENAYDTMKDNYPNISNQSSGVGCLRTVKRWIQQNQVNIGNVLQYKGKKLFISILLKISNHGSASRFFAEAILTIEYLVNKQSLFYLKLLSNIMKIIIALSSEFTSELRKRNYRIYIENLILILRKIDPQPALKMFQFEAQKEEQYERLLVIIFFPLNSKLLNINSFLIKATTEAIKKVQIYSETVFLEKLSNYLAGIACILQEQALSIDPDLMSFLYAVENMLTELKIKVSFVLKQYFLYIQSMIEKQYSKYLIILLGYTFTVVQTSQKLKIPKTIHSASQIASLYAKMLPSISKFSAIEKSQKQIQVQKFFSNLFHLKSQMILIDGEKNSIMSHNVGTASMADNDQQFAEIINNIKTS